MSDTPIITKMQVIPVAGYDSMLMTLSGCHAPAFTRNLVILEDSAGHQSIGRFFRKSISCRIQPQAMMVRAFRLWIFRS